MPPGLEAANPLSINSLWLSPHNLARLLRGFLPGSPLGAFCQTVSQAGSHDLNPPILERGGRVC